MPRDENQLILESNDGIRIEIGRPSFEFCLGLIDVDELNRELRRLFSFSSLRSNDEPRTLCDMFRLYTIKVTADEDSSLGKSSKRLHDLAEAAIFHFAFGRAIPISMTKTWARTYYWLGRKQNELVQFPIRTYNSELVGYYNLALASDSLVLGYLALYKILEYFFTEISETALHRKIKEHLVAPDFSHTKKRKLRELTKAIRSFDNKTDELSALKLLISQYFDKSDLRDWIEEYESENGSYFTENVEVFNASMKVDTSDSTIIPNIASRIYTIRNALVHNKEGEVSRYIPYSGQEEALHKEVQILMYLAEQMIIKTGTDLAR